MVTNRDFKNLKVIKNEELGQILTSSDLAEFMVKILIEGFEGKKVLDPCIGKNIFLKKLRVIEKKQNLDRHTKVGVEIDKSIVPDNDFWKKDDNYLYTINFFDFSPDMRFDGLIMNPPYVRQEKLIESKINNKSYIQSKLKNKYSQYLHPRHNLYVYFFFKAHKLLKDGGKLVSICYDSWMNTQYGEVFKSFLEEKFKIKNIYHFENEAFTNADIGATVLELIKEEDTTRNNINFHKYKKPGKNLEKPIKKTHIKNLNNLNNNPLNSNNLFDFSRKLFTPLPKICEGKIKRGINPKSNKYFLFNKKKFDETIPIVKEVKMIEGFSVNKKSLKYLLKIDSKKNISKETEQYLKKTKNEIMKGEKYKTLKREIERTGEWYKINFKEPGEFIFNYYLRNNIKFIYNADLYPASNNFYILKIEKNPYFIFSLLNSIITKHAVLKMARSQGSGLKKIQLYEFRKTPLMDPNVIPKNTKSNLIKFGKKILNTKNVNREKYMKKIDQELICVYNNLTNSDVNIEIAYEGLKI